jgi:Gpi18-like mannosyltransferase
MERLLAFKKVYWFAFPIIGIVIVFLFVGYSHWAYDDPFISYRYATNISQGLGFVYNPGERILSTTTPLFTIILALGGFLTTNLHLLAIAIGVISLAIGGLFIFDLSKTWRAPIVGWTGLLLYPTFPLVVSTLGSETPLYLALCLGAFAFYARNHYLNAGVLGALATLTRPDGVLVLLILGIDYLVRLRKPIPWKTILISSGILFVWVIFASFYFGSPIPGTLASKQQQGLMEISESFSRGFITIIRGYATWPYIIEAILALLGLFYAVWRKRLWVIILIWPIIYFFAYSLLGVTRYFWYYAPLIPSFVIAIGIGLTAISDHLKDVTREKKRLSYLPIFSSAIILVMLFAAQGRSLWQMRQLNDPRLAIYRAVGEWLNENTLSNEKVGSLEVGIIGYYAQRPMIDFAGLIQPEVAEQFKLKTTYENSALWAIENFSPQYVVLHDGLFNHVDHDLAERNCEMVKRIEGEPYSYSWDMKIYGCP